MPLTPGLASAPPCPFSVPRAGLLSALSHSLVTFQDRSAPHPQPRSHVGGTESFPQAFSCPNAPSRRAWVPHPGPSPPVHSASATPFQPGQRHPRQQDRPRSSRAAHLSLPCTVCPGVPTGGLPNNCSPAHTSRTLAWPPYVGRPECLPRLLPPPCWDRPPPASPSSTQLPASCPLLDCSVPQAPDTLHSSFLIWGAC